MLIVLYVFLAHRPVLPDTEYARLLPLPPYFCLSPLTPLISGAAVLAEVKDESCSLSQSGKQALSEDTVRWEGRKGKSELEKHSRELEGRKRRVFFVNSARTCGEKHSARQALKLHSKAAGVKQCQSCETHRTPLAKTRPRGRERPDTPIKCSPRRQNTHPVDTSLGSEECYHSSERLFQ